MLRGHQVRHRLAGAVAAVAVTAAAFTVAAAGAPATAAPPVMLAAESVNTPVTYAGNTFPSTVTAPTQDKPQSKLWYKDGSWWGMLISTSLGQFTVHELMPNHTWRDTGIVTESRPTSTSDALLVGNTLYVASRTSSGTVRVATFGYTSSSRTWAPTGSAKTVIGSGARSMTIALDTAGTLWVTYTAGTTVYVASAPLSTLNWTAPVALPVTDSTISTDDISGIIAFNGKVGVLYSDQQSNAMRFAVRVDGTPASQWTMETIYDDPGSADNHINIKTLVDDGQGRVFAAVKTSYDLIGVPSSSPIIRVLKRASNGTWTWATAGTIADKLTRPQLALDAEHNRMFLLMTGPTSGGTIYYKTSSLDTLSFSPGRGDVFMAAPGAVLNNVSTMKDPVDSTTDLVAIAGDDTNDRYYHAELSLDEGTSTTPPPGDSAAPSTPANVTATATAPTSVTVTWSASTDNVGVTGYRVLRNGSLLTTTGGSTLTYTDTTAAASTAYTYSVVAVDAAGNASGAGAAPSVTTPAPPSGSGIAFRAASVAQVGSGTSLVVSRPAGLTAGDVVIATVSSRGNPTITAPAGWNPVVTTTNSTTMRQAVYWRAAGASEPATWTFTLSSAKAAVVQLAAYSGVSTTSPVRAFAASVNASSTTVTAPSVSAQGNDAVVAVFGTARSANLSVTASLSKRTQIASVGGSNFVSGALGDRVASVSGSTGTFTATTSSAAASVGHTLALKPA